MSGLCKIGVHQTALIKRHNVKGYRSRRILTGKWCWKSHESRLGERRVVNRRYWDGKG